MMDIELKSLELQRLRRVFYSNRSKANYDALIKAATELEDYGEMLRERLASAGIETRVDHAYTPNERGSYGGKDHIVVLQPVSVGRLKRDTYDALCKPAAKFWGLEHTNESDANCVTCLKRAQGLVNQLMQESHV